MRPVPYYVKALAMAVPALLIGLQISAWIGFVLSPERQSRADFRAYYYSGQMLRAGRAHDLYAHYDAVNVTSAFIHPAYESLLFLPMSFVSMLAAHALWVVLNCIVILLIVRVISPALLHLRTVLPWLPLAMFAAYLPVNEALMQGQDSLLLALLISCCFMKLRNHESFVAGILLGLGVFRFQFLAITIILFLLWKRWRFVAGFCLSGALAFLVSTALVGWRGQVQYFHLLTRLADPNQQPMSHMVNLRALLGVAGISSPIALAALSAVGVLLLARVGRRQTSDSQFLLAIAAACLLSFHAFLHDLSLLIIPLIFICDQAFEMEKFLHLAVLAFVLALPTVLAILGLPLWLNSLGSVTILVQVAASTRWKPRQSPGKEFFSPIAVARV